MASKLAMLVNTEESMARFRSLYQIPPSVSLTYCNSDDFPVINRDEILLPIMAIVEGGVRFPLHSFLIDFLQTVNATPSQISVNTFRIIMGVIAINRLLDVNLTIREVLAVYQYKCLGPKSNTLSHLVARNVNEKLVNGLPSTNKGFEKDYLRVGGDWFPGSSLCRSEFGQPDQKRLESARKQGDAELIRRVLAAKHLRPVVPRSEAVEILPRAPYIAQPTEVERPEDFPDRIPTGQALRRKEKSQAKGKGKETDVPKKRKKLPKDSPVPETVSAPVAEQRTAPSHQATTPSPQAIHVIMESEQEEVLQSHQKEGRAEPSSIPAEGPSSHRAAWDPALLFGPNPISVRDTILNHSDVDASARVAHGLSFAACLPEDMKRWASTQPGDAFRQMTHGLMMTTQGVRSMEAKFYRLTEKFQKKEAEQKKLSELLKAAGDDYIRLEGQHHKNIAIMKEAEERARVEETRRAEAETIMKGAEERARVEETRRVEAEAEIVKLQEQVKRLESECVNRLGLAHQEGMEEGLVKGEELGLLKGKELGREGAMGEVTAQFKMVYNTGFRHGWKSALSKTGQPEMSELFLRTNTPLPYPNAGLRNSDDEGDEEDEEGEEEEEEEGEEEEEDGDEEGAEELGHKKEESKEGEGRKEEEKEKKKEDMPEASQQPGDKQDVQIIEIEDVVDTAEQLPDIPDQSEQTEGVTGQSSGS
uniref:Uncharacterized protein n=1 Tax=Fagus sylvatica TaxID=28930 RepID=A0A2N9ERS7_FAGSY